MGAFTSLSVDSYNFHHTGAVSMGGRSEFDEYFFGGGLEADAKKSVLQAIAELRTAGITPVNTSARIHSVASILETTTNHHYSVLPDV